MSSRVFKAGKQVLATPAQVKARELNWITYRILGLQGSFSSLKHSLKTTDLYTGSLGTEIELEYRLGKISVELKHIELLHKKLVKETLAKLTKEKGA